MLHYRLYFMHPWTGHILRFTEFEAQDDLTAFALARPHIGNHPLELWCEGRKVRRIDAGVDEREAVPDATWVGALTLT